ncbi:unnamed protein product [Litomosoides sigmodontis]|uniref:Uncharacterized protein n=1 Tax=Litomosoides sigmodontis TaxID=42156 RepID=A0A3P6TL77_LITSI|nr:unnamed protein product [Litomosoides sigmodontis]
MLVESYSLLSQNVTLCEALFTSLLIFASIATCMKKTKKKPEPEESVMLGTTIDTKIDSKKVQSLQKMQIEKDGKLSQPSNAADAKPNVEKTLLIEFERENNQTNKSNIDKNEKEATDDNQKLTQISKTQVASVESSIQCEKTQETSKQINHTKITSAESSKIQSSGKSEGSQKDETKAGSRQTPEPDSHATSKQEESSNKEAPLTRKA